MDLKGDSRFLLHEAVISLLETSRQSCVEDRRWCGQSKHPIACRGSVALYLLQNMFMNGSPKGLSLSKGNDPKTQGMLSKEPLHFPFLFTVPLPGPNRQVRSPREPTVCWGDG